MTEILTVQTDRIDDVPLLIAQMERFGCPPWIITCACSPNAFSVRSWRFYSIHVQRAGLCTIYVAGSFFIVITGVLQICGDELTGL
jgi:hypothetical protein